ncbi:hypothetical protein [Tepidiforma sp.]|uniref:hypothetical protein n=1 Tax=Tepidiforma sp. TaxID=2682230 RepID=UPI00261B1A5A|nr:hypothetical protein [Tepidiforma sp.]MCX7618911.1 hypothetical protein [Tepidiforma sp.]
MLSRDEAAVLELLRRRLELGHERYGPLDLGTAPNDYVQEALEEALDLAIYLVFRLIQLRRSSGDA